MLVLFDIDDTLVDHSTAMRKAVGALHAHVQSPLPLTEFSDHWAAAHRGHFDGFLRGELSYQEQRRARIREAIAATVSDTEADAMFAVYFETYRQSWELFPDVPDCLTALTPYRLGVVSNGQSTEQREKLVQTGIASHFEYVVISEDCGSAKPDPGIFHRACALAGEHPRDVLYIGDHYEIDAMGARSAGLHGVWLDRHRRATGKHDPPITTSLEDFSALVAGH